MDLRLGKIKMKIFTCCMLLIVSQLFLFGQTDSPATWKDDPLAYVQKLASEASKDQVIVQDNIKALSFQIIAAKKQISKSKDVQSKAHLKLDISKLNYDVSRFRDSLKIKINISKRYKSLLTLSPNAIRAILNASQNVSILSTGAPISIDTMVQDHSTHLAETKVAPFDITTSPDSVESKKGVTKKIKNKSNNSKKPKREKTSNPKKIEAIENGLDTKRIDSSALSTPLDITKAKEPTDKKEPPKNNSTNSNPISKWLNHSTPQIPCSLQPITIEKNKAIKSELLYTYTPDEVKRHFKGLNYTQGYAFLGVEPGYTYLQLNIEIASDQALIHYGTLGKSNLLIRLINGKEVRLVNTRYDSGKIDSGKKATYLSGIYYLDKSAERTLASAEIDSIRLHYVSGYEDYTIFNVDFFIRQLQCLNAFK